METGSAKKNPSAKAKRNADEPDPVLVAYLHEWRKIATSMSTQTPAFLAGSNMHGLVKLDDVSNPYVTPQVNVEDLRYFQSLMYGTFPRKDEVIAARLKKLDKLRSTYYKQGTSSNSGGNSSESGFGQKVEAKHQQDPNTLPPTTAVGQHTKLASEMASPAWERLQSLAENVLSMQESSEDKEHHYSYYVNQQLGDDDLGEMDPVLAQQVLERLMRERMQELVDADANDMEDAQDNQSKDDDEDDDDEDSSPRSPRDIRPDETPDIDDPEVSELLDWTEQLPEE
eukprot:TRINITY_DN5087_c0_g1_i1.p1 TRINITY_DN5087_c0_g1~~TRINITY_DN5087_c0_g1_i1.p1  ORF type:complete len:284 (+),score=85.56 TRINITY_DN5087_c0_g1_i1:39-890(+)